MSKPTKKETDIKDTKTKPDPKREKSGIDDVELRKMWDEGIKRKEIAQHFKTSEATINKRRKQLGLNSRISKR